MPTSISSVQTFTSCNANLMSSIAAFGRKEVSQVYVDLCSESFTMATMPALDYLMREKLGGLGRALQIPCRRIRNWELGPGLLPIVRLAW